MLMDARIPLMGQTPDLIGNFARGQATAQQGREFGHTNALRDMFQQHGAGIAAGDQNALAQFARFDPAAALGVQSTRAQMAEREQMLRMATAQAARQAEAHVASMSAAQRTAAAQELERTLAMAVTQTTPEGWDRVVTEAGAPHLAGQFENLEVLIAQALGLQQTLTRMAPPALSGTALSLAQRAEMAGLQPGTPEFQQFMVTGGGQPQTVVNVGGGEDVVTGPIPANYARVRDPSEPSGWRLERMRGGPDERAEQAAAVRAADRGTVVTEIITDATNAALEAARGGGGGPLGTVTRLAPWTASAELYRQIEVLRSNARMSNLQAMREASPTGGALGQVSDAEGRMLESASGALDPASPNFQRDLLRYTQALLNVVHGPEAGEQIFRQQVRVAPAQPAAAGGARPAAPTPRPAAPPGAAPPAPTPAAAPAPAPTPEELASLSDEELLALRDAAANPGGAPGVAARPPAAQAAPAVVPSPASPPVAPAPQARPASSPAPAYSGAGSAFASQGPAYGGAPLQRPTPSNAALAFPPRPTNALAEIGAGDVPPVTGTDFLDRAGAAELGGLPRLVDRFGAAGAPTAPTAADIARQLQNPNLPARERRRLEEALAFFGGDGSTAGAASRPAPAGPAAPGSARLTVEAIQRMGAAELLAITDEQISAMGQEEMAALHDRARQIRSAQQIRSGQ
jgi:hypothetical protein